MVARRSAGAKLRTKLNAALRATGIAGAEFTELETEAIDAAVQAADRGEKLREMFDAELAGEAKPTTLARQSAEARHCERRVVDLVAMVQLEPQPVKSPGISGRRVPAGSPGRA